MKNERGMHDEPRLRQRGVRLLSVAIGAAVAVGVVALSTPGLTPADGEYLRIDELPPVAASAMAQVAPLDDGVNWERVERAPDPVPMSVAAYER